ncbi:lipopolysaccharide biosynthesis protein [Pelotalea chapellei]|uniref:Oligosaccharide flippase family protein n=1 Tax=Pelotalea chapellei TaxID=44671 RepID=A0ABS5U4K5_9BACT|nr:oligosaccharide flippase family protein [Pelotalea chapellei]MBT1070610.1 oligosaccharide flippase family protein [Pelotalea chapellei]
MKAKALTSQMGVMLFTMIKGFVALKIMVQFGDHDYAMLAQFFVVSMFAVQFIAVNFDAPLVTSLVNRPQDHRLVFNGLAHLMLLNLLLLSVCAFLSPMTFSQWIWGEEAYLMVGLFLVYVLALSGNQLTLLCFQAERSFTAYSRLQIIQQLFQLFSLILGFWLKNILYVAMFAILFELLLWKAGWRYKTAISFTRAQLSQSRGWIRSNWSVAWPLFFSFIMIWGLNNYGRFLVIQQLDLKALASYAATFSIAILSGQLINPVCSIFFPYMSENGGRDENAIKSLLSGLTILLISTSSVGFVLTASTWILMKLVARADLFAGFAFVACVCAAQTAYGVARLANLSTVVRNKTMHGTAAFAAGLALSIVLGVWLGSYNGIIGIAASYCAGSIFAMSVIFYEVLPFIKKCCPQFSMPGFYLFVMLSIIMPFFTIFMDWSSLLRVAIIIPLFLSTYLFACFLILRNQSFFREIMKNIKFAGGRFA